MYKIIRVIKVAYIFFYIILSINTTSVVVSKLEIRNNFKINEKMSGYSSQVEYLILIIFYDKLIKKVLI